MVKVCHLERSATCLSEVLGTGEAAAALVQGVHPRWAAYRGLGVFVSLEIVGVLQNNFLVLITWQGKVPQEQERERATETLEKEKVEHTQHFQN